MGGFALSGVLPKVGAELVWRGGSALAGCLAYGSCWARFAVGFRLAGGHTFFLLRQEESSQRRRRPQATRSAAPTPLRYSLLAGAAELGATPLRQSSPSFRHQLRCSALHMGTRKGVAAEPLKMVLAVFQRSTAKKHPFCFFQGRAVVPRRLSGPPERR